MYYEMDKEHKKITLRLVLAWIFSVILILAGLGVMTSSIFGGLLIILSGAIIFPPLDKLTRKKYNFHISSVLKFFIVIIVFGIGMSLVISSSDSISDDSNGFSGDSGGGFDNIPDNQGSDSDSQAQNYNLNERVVWGDWAYTIHKVETKNELGSYLFGEFYGEKADGVFLIFDITIENVGKESNYYLFDLIQVIDNQERVFDKDGIAEIYLDEGDGFGFEQLQPGLPKKGKMVFDVPKDINGKLRISKGIFSSKYVYVSWN